MSVCFRIRSTVVIIRSPAVKPSPSRYGLSPSDFERAASTTLADLLTPPLGAHPFSTMRASLRRQSSEEFDDCVAHGGQSWLRRRAGDSFFSASLLRDGGAGGRRKRSLSSARDGEALARIAPRSDRDRVLLSAAGEPARKSNVP